MVPSTTKIKKKYLYRVDRRPKPMSVLVGVDTYTKICVCLWAFSISVYMKANGWGNRLLIYGMHI